jgi:caa(3)-type oxidase subunit IV
MPQQDVAIERRQPNYVLIWALLVAALGLSMLVGEMGLPVIAVVLIFTIAVVKAYMVMAYFMHIRFEPLYVTLILGSAVVCLYFLFFGLVPDIVHGPITS